MEGDALEHIVKRAGYFSAACSVAVALFDFSARDFLPGQGCAFCRGCRLASVDKCDQALTHLYGCFEAERWDGLYIYYCPLGLTFLSTVMGEHRAEYALVTGPLVMGSVGDVLADAAGEMVEEILSLPRKAPSEVTALAQTQWALCRYLSGKDARRDEEEEEKAARMRNSLYDVTAQIRETQELGYPLELEQRLQRMIVHGDRQGAQELINQLLGHLYFNMGGDFGQIREKAVELVVLFSRASIEGGADIGQIFGQSSNIVAEVSAAGSMDELSALLISIFYRFVGYVFDFGQVEHADILYKAVGYVREHYRERITLEDVANHVYLSKSYLSKLFKEEMGSSFTDFVNAVRIGRSKELLADHSLSLADIAALVGFSDQSYYTKVFRGVTGVSPGQFRKSGGKLRKG